MYIYLTNLTLHIHHINQPVLQYPSKVNKLPVPSHFSRDENLISRDKTVISQDSLKRKFWNKLQTNCILKYILKADYTQSTALENYCSVAVI